MISDLQMSGCYGVVPAEKLIHRDSYREAPPEKLLQAGSHRQLPIESIQRASYSEVAAERQLLNP